MKNFLTLASDALRKYMPEVATHNVVGMTLFALIYLAAQTELGRESSGGIAPVVIATAVYLPFMMLMLFNLVKARVLAQDRLYRDCILVALIWGATLSAAVLVLANSEILAMRAYTVGCVVIGGVYLAGVFRRDILADHLVWTWRGLAKGLRMAGAIMAVAFFVGAILSEIMIARGNVGGWVLARILWPVFGMKLAHAAIILHQLWIRRPTGPLGVGGAGRAA